MSFLAAVVFYLLLFVAEPVATEYTSPVFLCEDLRLVIYGGAEVDVSVTAWYLGDVVDQVTATTDYQTRLYLHLPDGLKDRVTVESGGLLFFVEGSCWSEPPSLPEPPPPTATPQQHIIRLPIVIQGGQ